LDHFHQDFPGLTLITYLPQEGDAGATHTLSGFQADMKAEAIDCGHCRFRSQQLLRMLPDAFIFTYAHRRGDLVQVNFSPNPNFKPSTHEAEVFHAMQGSLRSILSRTD
jgi:hypothetical protein